MIRTMQPSCAPVLGAGGGGTQLLSHISEKVVIICLSEKVCHLLCHRLDNPGAAGVPYKRGLVRKVVEHAASGVARLLPVAKHQLAVLILLQTSNKIVREGVGMCLLLGIWMRVQAGSLATHPRAPTTYPAGKRGK